MSVTAFIGIVAAVCTTVAFLPQIVKLRKQGGEDLSYSMLFLYLTGVVLWLAYGIRIHAVAMIWANALSTALVLVSIVLKANPPARKVDSASRRLRIAVDMDEVIADSFSKHLSQYNQRAGASLTPEMISQRGLAELFRANAAATSTPSRTRLDFLLTSRSLPAAGRRCSNSPAITTSTSPALPWKFLRRSRTSSSG